MKGKPLLAILCVVFLVMASFAGCAKSETTSNGALNRYDEGLYDSIADYAPTESVQESAKEQAAGSVGWMNQKLVRTMRIEAETNDMDALLGELDSRIRELGGYVENKSTRNGGSTSSHKYRYADMTIRIPADRLDEFVTHLNGKTNVVNYRESADDITLRYVATQSRVTALETEQQRLLELLAKAENMSDLLLIEERLTNVRTELEEYTSQMRVFDNMVDYGTVQLNITEVQVYTVVEEDTVWQRIGSGLSKNWKRLCEGAEGLFVFLVTSVPYLIPIGAAVAVTIVAVKLATRKTRKPVKPSGEDDKSE
jgi:hypothetical protein